MTDWFELGSALAPIIGILLVCLVICPPEFRSREERRREREWDRPSPEEIEGGDKWTCGQIGNRR